MERGAHRIAPGRLQVELLDIPMFQHSHIRPTSIVFRSDEDSRTFPTLVTRWADIFELDTRYRFLVLLDCEPDGFLDTISGAFVEAIVDHSFAPRRSSTETTSLLLVPVDLLRIFGLCHELFQLLGVFWHHVPLKGAFLGILQVELMAMGSHDTQHPGDVIGGDFDADLGGHQGRQFTFHGTEQIHDLLGVGLQILAPLGICFHFLRLVLQLLTGCQLQHHLRQFIELLVIRVHLFLGFR
mmetsp:Transcript_85429/g.104791  ORF Transcript_85429/g.104791 Transcript_85429/m.104791 type:complete len:240 (-) Transcript_85429:184-903(-)